MPRATSARAYACIRVEGGDVPHLGVLLMEGDVPHLVEARDVPDLVEVPLPDQARLLPLPVSMHMHVRL